MPFHFLKYIQPTHCFRLFTKSGKSVFPKADCLPELLLNKLLADNRFQSKTAMEYDLSWQAINLGYIDDVAVYNDFEKLSAFDNYCFIRKYFHTAWVFYVLLLRIFSLNNPIIEILGWYKTRHVKRILLNNPITYPNWESFKSPLIDRNPKVSVVIPTLNRYDYLNDVLLDFQNQDYSNFEILVIDQSDHFDEAFYDKYHIDIRVLRQKEKALWLARNNGIQQSSGEFIALSEDDVRIEPDWLSSHLKCLDFFKAKVSAGVFYPKGQSIPVERSFFAIASQFATGNAMLYKDVFKITGLFDRQFERQRMGDGEYGFRLYLADLKSISNPIASCIDVKASSGGLREMGSWDSFRPSSFFAPRPIPSVLYFYRRYFGNSPARWALLRTIPISIFPYQFKKNKMLLLLGALITILIMPLVFYQVLRSWQASSKKLKEGPIINQMS